MPTKRREASHPGIQRINAFMVLIDAKCAHGVED